MIPVLTYSVAPDRARAESLLTSLKLNPSEVALSKGDRAAAVTAVTAILTDIATRGDDALVDSSRKFDDPNFTEDQIRVTPDEMRSASTRVPPDLKSALKRAIAQVREYQTHVLPNEPTTLKRPGVELGLRFTPLDSAGLYVPGGKASYPSSLIHLAVPAQVAGVKQIVATTPPSKYGRSDLVLAAAHELNLDHLIRAGGPAAIAALAFGTQSAPRVDKIVGPGNTYVQLAKRALAGCVGIDGYLGPSEILTLADDTGNPRYIASDLIAQAEHDPGSCFLLTTSESLARQVIEELTRQLKQRHRAAAISKALDQSSAILLSDDLNELIAYANQFAAEHVNLQVQNPDEVLKTLVNAGAIFIGPHSPVAAGDYVAGPSHCLPTNTTARFSSGISVYEFLKRSSLVRYTPQGLAHDAPAIIALAQAEHLDGHAASIESRQSD